MATQPANYTNGLPSHVKPVKVKTVKEPDAKAEIQCYKPDSELFNAYVQYVAECGIEKDHKRVSAICFEDVIEKAVKKNRIFMKWHKQKTAPKTAAPHKP